ncbi:MAG: hypothetical protein JSS81_05835 [Acidobacteria bacterium]|nr:hypothetical protein [Acidobacteriota bacterium]
MAKKQTVEFVSHGNYEADLTPGSTVTTTSRKFADWLVGEFGLEEISDPSDDAEPQASKKTKAAKTNDGGDK